MAIRLEYFLRKTPVAFNTMHFPRGNCILFGSAEQTGSLRTA